MRIALRYEGGAGDCLCANRFVPAIYDRFPDAKIDVFLDTNGNKMQEKWLRTFYGYFYNDIITIPGKKYNPFVTDSQFAKGETTLGALENTPDEYLDRMKSYDRFYDMWIDGMQWAKYPFNFFKYFYEFPLPDDALNEVSPKFLLIKEKFWGMKYAVLNLIPDRIKDNKNISDDWYIRGLIKKLSVNIKCVLIATEVTYPRLKEFEGMENVEIFIGSIENVVGLIRDSSLFIGLDSGLKYFAHALGIPRIIFAEWCAEPHKISNAHKLRWLPTPEDCIPVNYDFNYVAGLATRLRDNPLLGVVPSIRNFENEAVVRNYTVDTAKSVLI